MAEDRFSDGLVVGILVGIFLGIPIGWIIAQAVPKPAPSSVIFDRDEQKTVTAIHYVPGGVKA